MALKEGLNNMPNESQKQSENSANSVNSTTSSEPESRWPTAKNEE